MNLSIVRAFISDQRRAKEIVASQLHIRQDITAMEWVSASSMLLKQFATRPFAEVFKPHGFGLELQMGDFYIDYDYSSEGRPDGFDPWRIFVFLTAGKFDNRGCDQYLCDRIFTWFDDLLRSRRIVRVDNLFYLTDGEIARCR